MSETSDHGTLGEWFTKQINQPAPEKKPSRAAKTSQSPEIGDIARAAFSHTKDTLDEIVESVKPEHASQAPVTEHPPMIQAAIDEAKRERARHTRSQAPAAEPAPPAVTPLLDIAGDHPLANYAREVAEAIQISRDSTFMIGLGLVSAIIGTSFCIKTPWGDDLPLGLYVTAEQPPAAGKSGVMRYFQRPFREAVRKMNEDRNNAIDAIGAQIEAAEDPEVKATLQEQRANMPRPLRGWITNTTPEALEKEAIDPNNGLFMLASDERGLLNSVFGLSYGKGSAVNMDAALKGFDGGTYVSVRATRRGFDGEVHGSIVCFAQPGSIESIMEASGGTGLAERFLWLSDRHNLGTRNHLAPRVKPDTSGYARLCSEIVGHMPGRFSIDRLTVLGLPAASLDELKRAKQDLEIELSDDGRFGNDAVRGAAGKLDLQVLKVAGVLHVARHLMSGDKVPPNIGRKDFDMALRICRELLERYLQALMQKRIVGLGAEADAVVEYLEKFPGGKDLALAKNSLRSKAAFKGASTKRIDDIINTLRTKGVVLSDRGVSGRETIKLA